MSLIVRTQLRKAVGSLLYGQTAADKRLYTDVGYPYIPQYDAVTPLIAISTPQEDIARSEGKASGVSHVEVTLIVSVIVKQNLDAAAVTDGICGQVQQLIMTDQYLGGLTCGIDLVKTTTVSNDKLERIMVFADMTYACMVLTADNNPYEVL